MTKIVRYSDPHLNSIPFDYWTNFDHFYTRLVWYTDRHCISNLTFCGRYLVFHSKWTNLLATYLCIVLKSTAALESVGIFVHQGSVNYFRAGLASTFLTSTVMVRLLD